MDARRAFQVPAPPQDHITIDKRALSHLQDRANTIWNETRKPNANLILLQALHDYMTQRGAKPNFTVKFE